MYGGDGLRMIDWFCFSYGQKKRAKYTMITFLLTTRPAHTNKQRQLATTSPWLHNIHPRHSPPPSPLPPPHHPRRNRYTRGESGGRRERGTPPPPSNLWKESASVTGEGVGNGRRPGRDMRASYQLRNALPLSLPLPPLSRNSPSYSKKQR